MKVLFKVADKSSLARPHNSITSNNNNRGRVSGGGPRLNTALVSRLLPTSVPPTSYHMVTTGRSAGGGGGHQRVVAQGHRPTNYTSYTINNNSQHDHVSLVKKVRDKIKQEASTKIASGGGGGASSGLLLPVGSVPTFCWGLAAAALQRTLTTARL